MTNFRHSNKHFFGLQSLLQSNFKPLIPIEPIEALHGSDDFSTDNFSEHLRIHTLKNWASIQLDH